MKNFMEKFIDFFKAMPREKNRFGLRVVLCFIGVFFQGVGVYFINEVRFGTDPCTLMNMQISKKVGLSYGNTLFIFNCILLLVVLFFGIKQIGIGTLANMTVVGYTVDLCTYTLGKITPAGFYDSMKNRILVFVPALIVFIFAAALYMAVDLGGSPYDATPVIISKKLNKIPFTVVRIAWDGVMMVVGLLLGGKLGVVTVAIVLFLGPAITFVKNMLRKIFGLK